MFSEVAGILNKEDERSLLEEARQEIGISVAELARRIDADPKRLWYVLSSQRTMRVEEFLKLCVALRIDPRRFITREMVEKILSNRTQKKRK